MNTRMNTDRRRRKSQEAIKKALVELITVKKFDQITIQDISDKADVGRRTFYLHYMDKFDLLDQLIDEQMQEMRQLCDSSEKDADYQEMGLAWFQYFENRALFFSAMLTNKGSSFFRSRLLDFFLQELKNTDVQNPGKPHPKTADPDEVDIQFLGAAIVGIVEWWFEQGKPLPPAIMAQRVGSLLERNLQVK
ncbi:TetR/AcrR family transcriptional regulator [Saccharibacillus qingshengii]|uniref:TetR/AcrR family transcriptional regulator n=1 Tax=Saccharibacillus qingshengii TaxID=1763540 RepID=UPI001FE7D823|nr:TetR-like C-terminal domain-containing protein [Saccharibacillus qingshengii]